MKTAVLIRNLANNKKDQIMNKKLIKVCKRINSPNDIASHLGMPGAEMHQIEKAIFKRTSCGAWVAFETASQEHLGDWEVEFTYLLVGSIVEGSDVECTTHRLKLPTTSEEFEDAMNSVEEEAEEIWREWNDDNEE